MKLDGYVKEVKKVTVDVSAKDILDVLRKHIITYLTKDNPSSNIESDCFLAEDGTIKRWEGDYHSDWRVTVDKNPDEKTIEIFKLISYLESVIK